MPVFKRVPVCESWTFNLKTGADHCLCLVFTQAEAIAFDPGLFPPGIAASNDPVLQTRVMAYADTQRYRLGVRTLARGSSELRA